MEKLTVIENGLVPVYTTDTGEKIVLGAELHKSLNVKSKFADWIKNRINDCDAKENTDFETFSKNLESGGRTIEYIIKLNTAKEMAMLERNEIGKQVRKYFISIEERFKAMAVTPVTMFEQMLLIFKDNDKRLTGLEERIAKMEGTIPAKPADDESHLPEDRFYTATNIGRGYGMSARKLNDFLYREGLIEPAVNGWYIAEKYADRKYAFNTDKCYFVDGQLVKRLFIWWTPKGKDYICKLLEQCDYVQVEAIEFKVPKPGMVGKK